MSEIQNESSMDNLLSFIDDNNNEVLTQPLKDINNEESINNVSEEVVQVQESENIQIQEQNISQEQHLETSATDINTIEIKTIFKADKPQQQHTDYNSMNVQTLKQHLKTKLSADGLQYNETAINKLNKKELIKHLTQG